MHPWEIAELRQSLRRPGGRPRRVLRGVQWRSHRLLRTVDSCPTGRRLHRQLRHQVVVDAADQRGEQPSKTRDQRPGLTGRCGYIVSIDGWVTEKPVESGAAEGAPAEGSFASTQVSTAELSRRPRRPLGWRGRSCPRYGHSRGRAGAPREIPSVSLSPPPDGRRGLVTFRNGRRSGDGQADWPVRRLPAPECDVPAGPGPRFSCPP